MKKEQKSLVCVWIGSGENCRCPAQFGGFYCEEHHERIYTAMPPEMADYIIDKELEALLRQHQHRLTHE